MKSIHEFQTPEQYNDYLRAYFAAQILATTPLGAHVENAERAVQRAEALIRALDAFIPDKKTFDY